MGALNFRDPCSPNAPVFQVIDMPAVIEIVSLLEKVTITKELLETTRLGKHVNELRRKTDNDSLSKRAKELVKKWRNMVLPDSNGQLKAVEEKKRPANRSPPVELGKRPKLNGQSAELELSDNSNSSFKDVISTKLKRDVILINSDSNSSFPEARQEPQLEQQLPKKRGRKKGSKNHKNLLDEAETSFTNKLAVSRGNSKVKTTQELIAGLQNKNNASLGASPVKPKEDLNVRAAKLTERVSIIDQKLNTNANRYKNSLKKNAPLQKITLGDKNDRVIESGSVINDKSLISQEEEVIVVDDVEPTEEEEKPPEQAEEVKLEEEEGNKITSLSVEEALALLPPIDRSVLDEEDPVPVCSCLLKEHKDFAVDETEELEKPFEFVEDSECRARLYYEEKSRGAEITPEDLHTKCIENVNGNWGVGLPKRGPEMTEDGLYVNVVPNVNTESIPKDVKADFSCENYKKYSISECDEGGDEKRTGSGERVFREWHEVLDTPSYNGEIFKILPYVIID